MTPEPATIERSPRDEPSVGGRLILTSGVLYAAAFLVTTVLHELAHFVVALGFDRDPTLFHNAVESRLFVSVAADVTTSLAGPAFSLLQGLALIPVERRSRTAPPFVRLFLVWLCFHGLMNAFGYVFTTGFVPDADLGSAANALGIPLVGRLALTALGFFLIRVGARWVYPGFVALLPAEAQRDVGARNRGLARLALFAWPIGVAFVLPASLPIPHWISLTYVVIAGVGAVWFTDFSKAGLTGTSERPLPERGWPVWPWALLFLLEILCIAVLRPGVHLG